MNGGQVQARDRLEISGGRARLIVGGRAREEVDCCTIEKLFVVRHEDQLYHGHEPFFVAVFPDRLWVVPEYTPGIDRFMKALAPRLSQEKRVYRALTPPRPFAWRMIILGFLPLFPIPRLAAHPLSSLPRWHESGPYSPAEVEEVAVELGYSDSLEGQGAAPL
ncbi:MAG: hypothetical protein QNJ67_02320 [Kiloniellales bacterium]|nr:hypothetical protein [Kiloniellales bacterium]